MTNQNEACLPKDFREREAAAEGEIGVGFGGTWKVMDGPRLLGGRGRKWLTKSKDERRVLDARCADSRFQPHWPS